MSKAQITISLLPWMSKDVEVLQEQGFLTTQESIDDAFMDAVQDILKKYQTLTEIRQEVFDCRLFESWEEERASRMGDISIHVRDIKQRRLDGGELHDRRSDGDWAMLDHCKHMYMTYQEWIDYMMEHWTDWKVGESKGHLYGWTEEQMKRHWPKKRFDAAKMKPCTCSMCKDGKSYCF
jgi:hypothetical protein